MNAFCRVAMVLVLLLAGSVFGWAQSSIPVNFEIRHYFTSDSRMVVRNLVEIYLHIGDSKDRKLFIETNSPFGGLCESTPPNGPYQLQIANTFADNYQLLIEKRQIRIRKQNLRYDRAVHDLVADSDWEELASIAIDGSKVKITAPVVLAARSLYQRPLSLQDQRLHGDDVWALQRFLVMQGYTDVGEIDGWFGPKTEKALKRFQTDHDLSPDGVVSPDVWDKVSGSEPELFRGDWG